MTPEIKEIKIVGKNLFSKLTTEGGSDNSGTWRGKLNFKPEEIIKNTSMDFDNPAISIEPKYGTETITFSRKQKYNEAQSGE